jgi:hypothetical protein
MKEMGENTMTQQEMFEIIINSLMQTPIENSNHRFDTSYDDEILCKTEDDANCIADFLEAMGFDTVLTKEIEDDTFSWAVYLDLGKGKV